MTVLLINLINCLKKLGGEKNQTHSKEVYNELTNIRQHINYLLDHTGYMFRPLDRSPSGLQQYKSKVLLRNWDPNVLYSCGQIWYCINSDTNIV